MAHVLAKLSGVPLANIRNQLNKDAAAHAEQGMTLAHLWQNAEKPDEVLFLFRVEDLDRCRARMKEIHAQAREQRPDMPLPELVFLREA
ncbi:hypothetical protein [Polaromonas sp.]|uniref:hypothetical protein n=1 Tax=Polaromonas sp. TaxID=1869339 RepID=UPI0032664FA2